MLLKTARIMRLSAIDTALRLTLPAAGPYLLTGAKLAVAYAFIGIIGSEFILSRGGIGYEISFAYNNFDNATMYPLIVLILLASIVINTVLTRWETDAARAQGRAMSARRIPRMDATRCWLIAALIALWQVTLLDRSATSRWRLRSSTLRYTVKLVTGETFGAHLFDTMRAFAIAFAISVVIGLLVGFWLGLRSSCPATSSSR